MPATGCLTINFGTAGNSLAFLGGGWAHPEPGFTWGVGAESHIILPHMADANAYVLTLDVVPFVRPPDLPRQRLVVLINDTIVGSSELHRPTLLAYPIRPSAIDLSDRVVVTLRHPDAARPTDFAGHADERELSVAVREAVVSCIDDKSEVSRLPIGLMLGPPRKQAFGPPIAISEWAEQRTGMNVPQLALQFESLGENCEFGLFQRRCDAEPLGLLRFSSTFMRNLIRGIEDRFDGLGAIDDIDPQLEGEPRREFMIHEKKFDLVYHTFVYEGERSAWLVREQEAARLKFLHRKFMEELEAAEKIFVYKRQTTGSEAEILPLLLALHRYAANTLLWVVPATPDRPCGSVEILRPGLLVGYIDRFAPDENAHDLSFDGWLQVCANACVLARLAKAGTA